MCIDKASRRRYVEWALHLPLRQTFGDSNKQWYFVKSKAAVLKIQLSRGPSYCNHIYKQAFNSSSKGGAAVLTYNVYF